MGFISEVHFHVQKAAVPRWPLGSGTRREQFSIHPHDKMEDFTAKPYLQPGTFFTFGLY